MPVQNDERRLDAVEWNHLSEAADKFAIALQKGKADDWEPFLQGSPANLRKPILHELIKIDLDHRWNHDEKPLLEEYFSRHPEIGDADTLPVDLIAEEYRIREKYGLKPDLDDYCGRFPEQFAKLKTAIEAQSSATG